MVAISIAVSLLFAYAGCAGAATTPNLSLHEARKQIPVGYSLHSTPAPDTVLKLRLGLISNDFPGLEKRLYDVSTPSSANYGKHLSKEEVDQYIAPTQESVAAVNAWLADHGLEAKSISSAGDWMALDVPVSKANELFGTEFSAFSHDETGRTMIRTLEYSIPNELQGHLALVHPTITFANLEPLAPVVSPPQKRQGLLRHILASTAPLSCEVSITPECLLDLYGIPATSATQSSNKLAVSGFLRQFANKADLKSFLTDYRPDFPRSTTFTLQTIDGGENPQNPDEAGVEANLDTQYTVGIASGVPVVFISVGDDNKDDLEGFIDLPNFLNGERAPPQVLTTSYGADEGGISPALASKLCEAYAQLGARGTSVLFSSGDGGVAGSQPNPGCFTFVPTFPSGCPYVTSVGSTMGIPEVAAPFSSGGFSNYFARPAFQEDAVSAYVSSLAGSVDIGRFNESGRAFPDVSTQGANFAVIVGGEQESVEGTSASSPTFASVIALINDERIAAGKAPLGWLNPFLYSTGADAFNDITLGSNPGCASPGFPAAEGWDPVTGLGTPNFPELAAAALALT